MEFVDMTQEDIIHMAREAGLHLYVNDLTAEPYAQIVEAFATLVAAAATEAANARANTSWSLMCKKMVAAEREACAKVCEDSVEYAGDTLAQAIRARG
jgi:hypothetical protein